MGVAAGASRRPNGAGVTWSRSRSDFFFSGRGERAWMQAAWRLLEHGSEATSDVEIEVTRV